MSYNFIHEPDKDLLCAICLNVAKDPMQHAECGQLFCKGCLKSHGEDKPCPNCKIADSVFYQDKKSKRNILDLAVKCTNVKKGCEWEGTVGTLEEHVATCKLAGGMSSEHADAELKAASASIVPDHWELHEGNCRLKEVREGTAEWNKIEQRIIEQEFPVKILRIQRIQNRWLWEVYKQALKRVSDKNNGITNEKELFHGTEKISPIMIYNSEQGFQSLIGARGRWGVGTYCAVNAEHADMYAHIIPAGDRQMFLMKVITGITFEYQPGSVPPEKADYSDSVLEDESYDSVSGIAYGFRMFLVYEPDKVYPAYLITYTKDPT